MLTMLSLLCQSNFYLRPMNVSIKKRIYWSFALLVLLFVVNGIASLITLNNNRKVSEHISKITDPSLQSLEDFGDLLTASKMYTTNWVFLRSNQDDKDALKRLHNLDYPKLKVKLNLLSGKWDHKQMADSLQKIYTGFEQLLVVEKGVMSSLQKFEDYNDPVAKFESERIIEDEVLPHTSRLMNSLSGIISYEQNIRNQKNKDLEEYSMRLRMLISILAITIIFLGTFLSLYMARVIVSPINKIRDMVNDLGKGIIRKVNHKVSNDEIGKMVRSVNNLSEKLQATATFATEIGNRNFNSYFEPLSAEDTLGKALIAMRNNIKSSYQKLNEAQHIAKLGSWERDVKNDHVSLSDELFCIFDIDPVSFDSSFQSILQLIHPEDIKNFQAIGRKYMQDHLPATYECRIISAKGVTKNISVQSKVVIDAHGEVIKTIGIVQDITERKKGELALSESQKQIQTIFNAALDAIVIIDEEGKIVKWDSKAEILFGWKQEEQLGMLLTETIIPQQYREAHRRGMKLFLKTGEGPILSKTIEVRAINKNNDEFDISLSISPSLIDGKHQFIGFIRDITSRKKAEAKLRKSEADLERNNRELIQKNRDLEQFAFAASHDLQEPLRTISDFVGLLRQQYQGKLDEKADKCLAFIIQSSDRMKIFIRDLLQYSRIGSDNTNEQVNCMVILDEVLADLGKAIEETNADIKADPLPFISGHPAEIKQLFQNLIVNAIKFRKKDSIPKIKISAQKKDNYWQFTFADNGIGIEEQYNEKIFVIFQRLHTRSEYQGSGIGLSNCKKIVELHNGKIWVDSKPGEGSTFQFTIQQNNN